jgi:hypothetical protein
MSATAMAHIQHGRLAVVGTVAITLWACRGQTDIRGGHAGGATTAGGTSPAAGRTPVSGEMASGGGTDASERGGMTGGSGHGSGGYGGGPCTGTLDQIAPGFGSACPSSYPSAEEWRVTCTYGHGYLGSCGGYLAWVVSPGTWKKSCYYDASNLELVGAEAQDDVPSFCNRSSSTFAAGTYPDSCPISLLSDLGECVMGTADAGVGDGRGGGSWIQGGTATGGGALVHGGAGGTGSGMAGVGTGGIGGEFPHVFQRAWGGAGPMPTECGPALGCSTGQICFWLSADFGLCDRPQPVERTECTPGLPPASAVADECGCNGLSCGEGQVCAQVEQWCSCQSVPYNACLATACTAPTDCAPGSVCRPSSFILSLRNWLQPDYLLSLQESRCLVPKCRSDADCTADGQGHCSALIALPTQAGDPALTSVDCVYPGPPVDGTILYVGGSALGHGVFSP